MRRMPGLVVVVIAATLFCAANSSGTARAEEVGHFDQVLNQVSYMKQGKGPPQPAKVKDGVENQDMVRTAEQSRALMRFIDETTMTVGPKSELTIEEYMYDASKGKRRAMVQLLSGVVETVAPHVASTGDSEFTLRTPTATAGIRGTKYITVAGPDFTIFYVLSGKIRVKSYSPEIDPNTPAMKFVADGLKRKLPTKEIIDQGLAAGMEPCDLIKAAVIQGVSLDALAKAFMDKYLVDPEIKKICTPCVIMKCAVRAMRAMKEEDVGAGKYAVLMTSLAPILGDITAGDLATISKIVESGIPADLSTLPGYPVSEAQLAAASLPEATEAVAQDMIAAGFDPVAVEDCQTALTYTPPPTLPDVISPVVTPSFAGQSVEKPVASPTN